MKKHAKLDHALAWINQSTCNYHNVRSVTALRENSYESVYFIKNELMKQKALCC